MNPPKIPTPSSSVFSIKCTNCAAPLKILGGGRVSTVTCEYCNSLLDLNDKYKVVTQFHDKYRPPVPFTLGMRGKIKDVEWTIIGWVSYRTVIFPTERWSEFFLYSPLYGYGWLIYEEGKLSFSKRVRDFALREWQEKSNKKAVFYQRGHYLADDDSYLCEIDFVQGELSWIAKADDKVRCWDYNGTKGKSLSIEKTNDEVEVYLNEKLDTRQVYNSFGVKKEKQVVPKQSVQEKILEETEKAESYAPDLMRYIKVLAILVLFIIAASFFSDKTVLSEKFNSDITRTFTINSSAFLTEIELKTPNKKRLDSYELTLNKNGKQLLTINKSRVFFTESYLENTWVKGSTGVSLHIKLDSGFYTISLKDTSTVLAKASRELKNKKLKTSGNVKSTLTVKERYAKIDYFIILLVTIFMVFFFFSMANAMSGRKGVGFWFINVIVLVAGFMYFGFAWLILLFVVFIAMALLLPKKREEDSSDE